MIVSCFTNSYGRFGAAAAIEHLRSAGIQWLELPVRTAGVPSFFGDQPLLTHESKPADVDRVRRRIEAHGLGLSSANVTSGNPLDPEVVAITRRKLDIARDLGVTLVVGGAGEADTSQDRETLFRQLAGIADHAARLGITYCCETHPGLCRTPEGMLETMRRLDHPHLRLNFDTGNILYYNDGLDGAAALAAVRDFVRHVHLKDTRGRAGEWHFPALGAGGAVDFTRTRAILDHVAFDGPFSLEIEGIAGEPELTLADYQQRIVQSVTHLRACGYFDT